MEAHLPAGFYSAQNYTFDHVVGLSKEQLEHHYKLFLYYISTLNSLIKKIKRISRSPDFDSAYYAEIKRRIGFEFNRIRLHECYFRNMRGPYKALSRRSPFYREIVAQFGSFDAWKTDFINTASIQNAGWAILYFDQWTKQLTNLWIRGTESGQPIGFHPLIVLDLCEHAYALDFKAHNRQRYLNVFFKNLYWEEVESRFLAVSNTYSLPERKFS